MDLFGLGIAIFYFLIISKSYEWICEEIITLVFSNSFALSKFLFPLVVYLYLRKLKKSEKYKAIFISLLLSLLYQSTHTFIDCNINTQEINRYLSFFVALQMSS